MQITTTAAATVMATVLIAATAEATTALLIRSRQYEEVSGGGAMPPTNITDVEEGESFSERLDDGPFVEGSIPADPPAPLSVIEKFYSVRRDWRRCMVPMCGGWWVKSVNEETTRCVDGVDAEECYVAEIDLGDLRDEVVSLFLSSGGNLVLGSVRPEEYDLGTFGFMTAVGTWYIYGGKFVVTDAQGSDD